MEPVCLFESRPFPACRCGDSRLATKTNRNFLSKCGQCRQKFRGPLCANCGFHCCTQCRKINQNNWKTRISSLKHWNDNSLKQQEEYKEILHSIPQIFILYNNKDLVQTLCDHVYNTRNKEVISIFLGIIDKNEKVLINAFYSIFENAINTENLTELLYLKNLGIITKKYLYEFRKKNGINVLHHVCTVNIDIAPIIKNGNDINKSINTNKTIKKRLQIIKYIMGLIIEFRLLHRNIYDITSIFEFSVYCNNNKENEQEILNILDIYINNEIKQRGLRKWIDSYSLRRLPLYAYVSWSFCSKIPFSVMNWVINNTIKYQIVPYFLSKYKKQRTNDNKKKDDEQKEDKKENINSLKFKTYNRIFYPLLIMESNYISQRSLIYEWMALFIEMDSEIFLSSSCILNSLPLKDAMSLNSNMVESIMGLSVNELYRNYSLHSFIDIACFNPKLEYRVLQWIQLCIEKYDQRLLFKNIKHLSPLKYAEKHPQYYCSQIILYLKRKQSYSLSHLSTNINKYKYNKLDILKKKNIENKLNYDLNDKLENNKGNKLQCLQNEILHLKKENNELKKENLKWRNQYFKLNKMYENAMNGKQNKRENGYNNNNHRRHHRIHSYPTPKGMEIKQEEIHNGMNGMNGIDEIDENRRNNGFLSKNYREWNCNDIVNWIISLNVKYRKYENILFSNIIKENVRGKHLSLLNRNDLTRFGINDFGDKYDIIQQIRTLLIKHNQKIQKEGFVSNHDNQYNDDDNQCLQ